MPEHPYGVCNVCEEPFWRPGSQAHTDPTPPECGCPKEAAPPRELLWRHIGYCHNYGHIEGVKDDWLPEDDNEDCLACPEIFNDPALNALARKHSKVQPYGVHQQSWREAIRITKALGRKFVAEEVMAGGWIEEIHYED